MRTNYANTQRLAAQALANGRPTVTPAKAGVQGAAGMMSPSGPSLRRRTWIPAYAGMTG